MSLAWGRATAFQFSSRTWLFLGAAFALWLNANPYIGIDHDARLYAVAAYRWLHPASFAKDPWFLFGSQDDFSLFSPLLAAAFSLLGVSRGAQCFTVVQGMLFAVAVVTLAQRGFGRVRFGVAALLMVAFPVLYSPRGMLYVTEGFVTARGFAVPLSLLGLAMSVCRRRAYAGLFHGMALLLHPLMALAPAVVSLLHPLSWQRRRVLLLLALSVYVSLLLAALGGHLPLIEGNWRRYLVEAPLIFVDGWIVEEWPWLLLWAALLITAARWGAPRLRGMYVLVPVVTTIAVGFSLLGTIVPWALAMQAQFWRALWLMKLFGLCAVADLVSGLLFRPRKGGSYWKWTISAFLLWAGFSHPLWAVAALGLYCWTKARNLIDSWLGRYPKAHWIATLTFAVLSVPELVFAMTDRVKGFSIIGYWNEALHGFWRTAGLGGLAVGLALLLARLPPRRSVPLVLLLIPASLLTWDSRSSGREAQEACYTLDGRGNCLGFSIPAGATVLWPEQTERVWLELGTSSYAGGIHATGLVFSRERMVLIEKRLERTAVSTLPENTLPAFDDAPAVHAAALKLLSTRPFVDPNVPASWDAAGSPSSAGIAWLCRDPKLDFVVAAMARSDDHLQSSYSRERKWKLFRCEDIARRPSL